jgi:hypothetical protein
VKGTITWINHDDRAPLYYKSCPDNNKKVVENKGDKPGRWICEATGQVRIFISFFFLSFSDSVPFTLSAFLPSH